MKQGTSDDGEMFFMITVVCVVLFLLLSCATVPPISTSVPIPTSEAPHLQCADYGAEVDCAFEPYAPPYEAVYHIAHCPDVLQVQADAHGHEDGGVACFYWERR